MDSSNESTKTAATYGIRSSSEVSEIAQALVAAQGAMPTIERNRTVQVRTKTGGSYEFAYATLDEIVTKSRPVFAAHKLAIFGGVGPESSWQCRIVHESGEWFEISVPLAVGQTSDPQALGSAITYARRYCLGAIAGIAPEDDDDGERARQRQEKPRASRPGPPQRESAPPFTPVLNTFPHPLTEHIDESAWSEIVSEWHDGKRVSVPQMNKLFATATANGWDKDSMRSVLAHHLGLESMKQLVADWSARGKQPYTKLLSIFEQHEPYDVPEPPSADGELPLE